MQFLLTHPLRDVTRVQADVDGLTKISTHTPLAGCDRNILSKTLQSVPHMGWTLFCYKKQIDNFSKKQRFPRRTSQYFYITVASPNHISLP